MLEKESYGATGVIAGIVKKRLFQYGNIRILEILCFFQYHHFPGLLI